MKKFLLMLIIALSSASLIAATNINELMDYYSQNEKLSFSTERGKQLWEQQNVGEDGKNRDCSTCHGKDLTKPGKHIKSGKVIDPLAKSVNSERFTELKTVKKWFKRNCKWTYGRECTDQEKGDILKYLSQF